MGGYIWFCSFNMSHNSKTNAKVVSLSTLYHGKTERLPLLTGLEVLGSEWHLLRLTPLSSLKEQRWSLSRLPSWKVHSRSYSASGKSGVNRCAWENTGGRVKKTGGERNGFWVSGTDCLLAKQKNPLLRTPTCSEIKWYLQFFHHETVFLLQWLVAKC